MNIFILFISLIFTSCLSKEHGQNDTTSMQYKESENLFVVELYTSQGCSSCPPADKVLEDISKSYSLDQVIPLSFHVDYWNRLGWKDPYSKPEYTERQRLFGNYLNLQTIYTPQAVINGKYELIGSHKNEIQQYLADYRNAIIKLKTNNPTYSDGKISINILNNDMPDQSKIIIIEVSTKETNSIPAGENVGRKLMHINVVKEISEYPFNSNFTFQPINQPNDSVFYVILIEEKRQKIKFAKAFKI